MQSLVKLKNKKNVNSEVNPVLNRGVKFFNRVFTTSISTIADTLTYNTAVKDSLKSRVREIFYDIDVTENGIITSSSYHLFKDGSFKKELRILKNGRWERYKKNSSYFLINGEWRKDHKSFIIQGGAIIIDNIYQIDILRNRNIAGQYSMGGLDINMPKGAKFYTNSIKQLKNLFVLNHKVSNLSLKNFIKKHSKTEWFDGFKYGGISFGDTSVSKRAGKIWYIQKFKKNLKVISKDVGEWRVENCGSSEILIVNLKEQKDIIFSNLNGALYQGEILKDKKVVKQYFNKEAFDAISAIITKKL